MKHILACLAVVLLLLPVPASASGTVATPSTGEAAADASQCILEPGVYVITDSQGTFVGLRIIYPDCTVEILPRPGANEP